MRFFGLLLTIYDIFSSISEVERKGYKILINIEFHDFPGNLFIFHGFLRFFMIFLDFYRFLLVMLGSGGFLPSLHFY